VAGDGGVFLILAVVAGDAGISVAGRAASKLSGSDHRLRRAANPGNRRVRKPAVRYASLSRAAAPGRARTGRRPARSAPALARRS
jgi:hypothetical protein